MLAWPGTGRPGLREEHYLIARSRLSWMWATWGAGDRGQVWELPLLGRTPALKTSVKTGCESQSSSFLSFHKHRLATVALDLETLFLYHQAWSSDPFSDPAWLQKPFSSAHPHALTIEWFLHMIGSKRWPTWSKHPSLTILENSVP